VVATSATRNAGSMLVALIVDKESRSRVFEARLMITVTVSLSFARVASERPKVSGTEASPGIGTIQGDERSKLYCVSGNTERHCAQRRLL